MLFLCVEKVAIEKRRKSLELSVGPVVPFAITYERNWYGLSCPFIFVLTSVFCGISIVLFYRLTDLFGGNKESHLYQQLLLLSPPLSFHLGLTATAISAFHTVSLIHHLWYRISTFL